jgi:hypothetical protein
LRKLKCIKIIFKLLGRFTKKKSILIIGIIITVGFFSILISQAVSDAMKIQIENENIEIYSNQPYAPQIVDKCRDDIHCSVNAMHTLAKLEDKDEVLDIFSNLITFYETKYPCHEIGHHLGMWLNAYVGDPLEALEIAKQQCGGSIFHGIIQNYLQIQKFKNISLDDIDIHEICSRFKNESSFINRWQCLHGLGHGLADIYNYDIKTAINRCDEFEPGLEQISCSKGIFMQNVVHWAETGNGDFEEEDLYYPCNVSPSKYAPSCYHYHITYMAAMSGGARVQIPDAFDLCDGITPEEEIKFCYYGMGRQMQSRTYLDWERALFLCQQGDRKDLHPYCLEGMLMTLVNGNTNPELGFSFCEGLPSESKVTCYNGLGKWISMLSTNNDERMNYCSMAESKNYFDICMAAKTDSLKLL